MPAHDFNGNELTDGDRVIFYDHAGNGLGYAFITKVMPKMVQLEPSPRMKWDHRTNIRALHNQVIKANLD